MKKLVRWLGDSAFQFDGIIMARHRGDEDFLDEDVAKRLAVCNVVEIIEVVTPEPIAEDDDELFDVDGS